jgi:hypothetical protein
MIRCTGIKQSGEQCSRMGAERCYQHKDCTQCPICMENMRPSTTNTLTCNHSFHTSCLARWSLAHTTCPMCRSPFAQRQPLYQVTIGVQRISDGERITHTFRTSNITGLVNEFHIDPNLITPQFLTEINFGVSLDEMLETIFEDLGLPSMSFTRPNTIPPA